MDLDKLQASLIAHEGLRLKVYFDSVGKATIGVGRNISDVGISEPEALVLLGNDIQSCLAQAQGEPWWPVVADDDVRSRAMVEILFNLGLAGLRGFPVALAALEQRDFAGAAAGFRDSIWYNQVGSQPGQRGYVLAQMIETGLDSQ
jgi:lysozyme